MLGIWERYRGVVVKVYQWRRFVLIFLAVEERKKEGQKKGDVGKRWRG